MIEDSPRYARSAECAAHIVNLLAGDYPGGKVQLYGHVLCIILCVMTEAQEDLKERWLEPSKN